MMATAGDLPNRTRLFSILLIIIISLLIIVLGIVAATLSSVKSQKHNYNLNEATTTVPPVAAQTLSDTISSGQLMDHLEQLQIIADRNDNRRPVGTPGLQETIDYIETQLQSKTNFRIFKQEFRMNSTIFVVPILTSTISEIDKNYTFETDFITIRSSPIASLLTPVRLTVIPNSGCNDVDWQIAMPYPATNSITLVIHDGNCSVASKSELAQNHGVVGLLVYDGNENATRWPSAFVPSNTTFPAMMVSYNIGAELLKAAENYLTTNVSIRIVATAGHRIQVPISIENLCADTPTGNKTQTIVVGSHSDSVEYGPGINDNGSGTMAVLVLALNLARQFQTSSYEKYLYRIRFCWWGAEERLLAGSSYHVKEAMNTTVEGDRLRDYIMVLNFDMLASPNYYFGILERTSLVTIASAAVQNASLKISQVFRNWFDKNKLPWDNVSLTIQSDQYSFLVEGVAVGGVVAGANEDKTLEQRNRYDRMLGHGHGGIAHMACDPCYHDTCDTIENINPFAYETLTKSAAHVLETFGRMQDLRLWIYGPSQSTTN